MTEIWESGVGLGPGELNERMADVWHGGGVGTISKDDVRQAVRERLGLEAGCGLPDLGQDLAWMDSASR